MWNSDGSRAERARKLLEAPATLLARATWLVPPALRTEEMFRCIDRGMSPVRALRMLWVVRHEYRIGRPIGR